MTRLTIELLEEARLMERGQTRFYRGLAAEAEIRGEPEMAERLNALHADEQHHISRLTARLLELGVTPSKEERPVEPIDFAEWEVVARKRETDEISWYEAALRDSQVDDRTRSIFMEILESERHHARELGGKWMPA